MANRDQVKTGRARAVQRLNEVVMERRRLRDSQPTARDASTGARATVSLRAVDDQRTARDPQLKTVVDRQRD
jgi:hypothetical protein